MAAHRYWRIVAPDTTVTGEFFGLSELELHTSIGGADVTTGKTATASAAHGSFPPGNAIDNNTSTLWTTGVVAPPPGGHWIQVDLGVGGALDIIEISLRVRGDASREDPRHLKVYYSDDNVNFTLQWEQAAIAAWTAGQTRVYDIRPGAAITITKATLQVASGYTPEGVTVQKATLQLASRSSGMITITKMTMQVVSKAADASGRRRMSLM